MTSLAGAADIGGPLFLPTGLLKRILKLGAARRFVYARLVTEDDVQGARYLGEGDSLDFLATLHGARVERRNTVSITRLRRMVRDRDPGSLLYVETNRLLGPLLPRGGHATVPWIRQRVPLGAEPGAASAVESVYGRKIRKYGQTHRLTSDAATVREFHTEFYVPYIADRFGEAAHPRSRRVLESVARRGFLLQVLDEDDWVSGVMCLPRRHEVTAVAFGLRGDPDTMLKRGALSACTYFLLCWARERGMRSVDLLRSRPHAKDGVFEHKRRFGAVAEVDAWPHTSIRVFPPFDRPLPDAAAGLLVVGASGLTPLSSVVGEA